MDTLEKEAVELPLINPWRTTPTRKQVSFALDLCRSELTPAQRASTIEQFPRMSGQQMSGLIRSLLGMRSRRLRGGKRDRTWRLVL